MFQRLCAVVIACLGIGMLACDSSSSGNQEAGTFQLVGTSVPDGGVWEVNRAIELRFSAPVDLATVSANTIEIRDPSGPDGWVVDGSYAT